MSASGNDEDHLFFFYNEKIGLEFFLAFRFPGIPRYFLLNLKNNVKFLDNSLASYIDK